MGFISIIFLIFLGKEVLVFNAESLILFCFILFVCVLVHFLGSSVISFFEDRAQSLERIYYIQRQEIELCFIEIKNQLEKEKIDLEKLQAYAKFFRAAEEAIFEKAQFNLRLKVKDHLLNKLRRLHVIELQRLQEIQEEISVVVSDLVRFNFSSKNKKNKVICNNLLVQSVELLKKTK